MVPKFKIDQPVIFDVGGVKRKGKIVMPFVNTSNAEFLDYKIRDSESGLLYSEKESEIEADVQHKD